MPCAIHTESLGKRYVKFDQRAMLLRSILPFGRERRSELWALRNVDIDIAKGETVGVLGRNGSGKTTLLRMLCGVTAPSEGALTVTGRLAPLIGVGVGFHREMSGRENVFVNGMLLGLTEGEVAERFDAIVDFAELHDFIDTPVKFYSSGMFVRLGFAVAVHADPDVLLVDEVLAVGDVAYQMKCVERMRLLQEQGCTIVVVSHSMGAIRAICPRSLLLHRGSLEFDGPTTQAVGRYHELLSEYGVDDAEEAVRSGDGRHVVGGARIVSRRLVGPDGSDVSYVNRGDALEARLVVRFDQAIDDPLFGINVLGEDGRAAYGVHSPVGLSHRSFTAGEEAEVSVRFVANLVGGTFRVTSVVTSADGRDIHATDGAGLMFFVDPPHHAYGIADLGGVVQVDGVALEEHRSFRLDAPAPVAGRGLF